MTVKEYYLPESGEDALALLAELGPSLLVIAGGTVAMPLINEGISLPERVMGLRRAGLDRVDRYDGQLRIGAAATLTQLLDLSGVPLLEEAVRNTASWPIRNMATVGGNLFTPPPGGDVAVALLALDANVTLASVRGERTIPLEQFYTGFLTNQLQPDELLVEIRVPLRSGETAFVKHGRKHANTPAVVTVAVRIVREDKRVGEARIALGGVSPHPIRALAAEADLVGGPLGAAGIARAAASAVEACDPPTDAISTGWYRRRMVEVFVRRALTELEQGQRGEVR
jgi:CO/xanthine dehydrogenase FAD-binding subunit